MARCGRAAARNEREPAADRSTPPAWSSTAGQRRVQQAHRLLRCTRVMRRHGRSDQSFDTWARGWRKLGRALQERSGRRDPSSCPCPLYRPLESDGDVLIRSHGRAGAVPRASVRVAVDVRRVSQRTVHGAPISRRRRTVDRGADEWMTEADARTDDDQCVRLLGGVEVLKVQLELGPGPPEQPGSPVGSAAASSRSMRLSSGIELMSANRPLRWAVIEPSRLEASDQWNG